MDKLKLALVTRIYFKLYTFSYFQLSTINYKLSDWEAWVRPRP